MAIQQDIKPSRKKKMAKDFLIYSIGVIGSKLMTFLLLPLYTHYIQDPAEYGYYDLCLSACFLLMPIVSLQLRDGAFRFLLETTESKEKSQIVTFINKVLITSTVLTLLIALLVYFIHPFRYLGYTVILLITSTFYDVYAQTVRGLGNNRSFIAVSIISSLCIALFSIIFIVILEMGVPGIFGANILARIIAIGFVDYKEKALKVYFKFRQNINKELGKSILHFSIPLLPVAMSWWFIGFCNRYYITEYLNYHDSGIYGVASRLATVVQTIATIFLQTWQENAIQQYNSPDRNAFFSKIFNGYIYSFVFVIIIYSIGAKIIFPLLFNANYVESLNYLYPLCVATMCFGLAGYFEIIYQCEKKTNRLLLPAILAPLINIILNYMLIKPLGINGVIISYALVYILIILYRWIDIRKFVQIKLQYNIVIPVLILVAGFIPFNWTTTIITDVLFAIVSIVSLFITSKNFREIIANKFIQKITRRKSQKK